MCREKQTKMPDKALHRIADSFVELNKQQASDLPKYQKVSRVIRNMIDQEELKPGDMLPRELDLAGTLSVSLGTVRSAMNALSSEGYLSREQGRGTFVTERGSELVDLWHFRFIDTNGDRIVPVYTKVLSIDKVRDEGPWSVFLGADRYYVRISRMIGVSHDCNAIGQFYLRGDQYAELLTELPESFDGLHLRNIVKNRFGKPTISIEERISAERLPDAVCHWLDLPYFSIGMVCQILGHTHRKLPLSFQHVFVPANTYPLQIRETNPNDKSN